MTAPTRPSIPPRSAPTSNAVCTLSGVVLTSRPRLCTLQLPFWHTHERLLGLAQCLRHQQC